jgi:hypothetical protein
MNNLLSLANKRDKLIASTESENKSRRVAYDSNESRCPFMEGIAKSLFSTWKSLQDFEEKSKIEIEFRVGMIVLNDFRWMPTISENLVLVLTDETKQRLKESVKFVPGIDETHLHNLNSNVFSSKFVAEKKVILFLLSTL